MKRLLIYIFLIVGFLVNHTPIFSEWENVDGVFNISVKSLATSDTILFVGSLWGIYIISDWGQHWAKVDSLWNVRHIAKFGSKLFIAVLAPESQYSDYGTVFRSTDNGLSWKEVNTGLPSKLYGVNYIFSFDTLLFLGTSDGVYASTNEGDNWFKSSNGIPERTEIFSFVSFGSKLFAGTSDGVYLSADSGRNWEKSSNGLPKTIVWSFTIIDSIIIAGTGEGIFRSYDEGKTWTKSDKISSVVFTFLNHKSKILAGTRDGIYVSTNKGSDWEFINTGLDSTSMVSSLANYGPYIVAGTNEGLYFSVNSGLSWRKWFLPGGQGNPIRSIAFLDSNIFVSTGKGIFIYKKNTLQWMEITDGIPRNTLINRLKIFDNRILAGTTNGIYFSTNNGELWEPANGLEANTEVTDFCVVDSLIFAGTSNGLYVSSNAGEDWQPVTKGLPPPRISVGRMAIAGNNIFANVFVIIEPSLSVGYLYRSTNGGESWSPVNTKITYDFIALIAKDTKLFGILYNYPEGEIVSVVLSSDLGNTWKPLNGLPKSNFRFPEALTAYGPYLFVSYFNISDGPSHIYMSTNEGEEWIDITKHKPHDEPHNVITIEINGGFIYAGTIKDGLWRRPLEEIISSVDEIKTEVPKGTKISAVYPNPFDSKVTIQFEIDRTTFVSLKVYDILGNEIATLVSNVLAPGKYEKEWDAVGFTSGIYFYRLQTMDFVDTKAIILHR